MNYQEMTAAITDADATLRLADVKSKAFAKLLVGRLRAVSGQWGGDEVLRELKRELTQFNASTGQWKS